MPLATEGRIYIYIDNYKYKHWKPTCVHFSHLTLYLTLCTSKNCSRR